MIEDNYLLPLLEVISFVIASLVVMIYFDIIVTQSRCIIAILLLR